MMSLLKCQKMKMITNDDNDNYYIDVDDCVDDDDDVYAKLVGMLKQRASKQSNKQACRHAVVEAHRLYQARHANS